MGVGLRFGAGPLRVFIPLSGGRRKRRRRKSKHWTHQGCSIRHQSVGAADRCKIGRAPAYAPSPGYAPPPAPVKAKATPKQTAVRVVAGTAIAGGLVAIGAHQRAVDAARPHSETVSRATFTGAWPLTVDSGVLSCKGGYEVVFTVGRVAYEQFGGVGYTDLAAITADDPQTAGLKRNVFDLMEEGRALC